MRSVIRHGAAQTFRQPGARRGRIKYFRFLAATHHPTVKFVRHRYFPLEYDIPVPGVGADYAAWFQKGLEYRPHPRLEAGFRKVVSSRFKV